MWVKLGNEYLNLDQVVRIRFTKAFRAGHEEWAAEVDGLIKGELQVITRYRGAEANALQIALAPQLLPTSPGALVADAIAAPFATHAQSNTLHDIKVPS